MFTDRIQKPEPPWGGGCVMWKDDGKRLIIKTDDFNYAECLKYLNRNQNEILHLIDGEHRITKAIKLGERPVLFRIHFEAEGLIVSFPMQVPNEEERRQTALYIMDWFDLQRDLQPFYRMAESDPVLKNVIPLYKGLRIIGVPDLFEAMCWAIIGQQVSLHVAYLVKKRFVETFGDSVTWEGQRFWLFPTVKAIAELTVEDLLPHKFTQKKAEYLLTVAKLMQEGKLSKNNLRDNADVAYMEQRLTAIRGIGSWSANYVIMRCLRHRDAFPIADVGLHNALKHVLQLERKPSLQEIGAWSEKWAPWRAYATFYLWRTLLT